jgi:hypothetical protein
MSVVQQLFDAGVGFITLISRHASLFPLTAASGVLQHRPWPFVTPLTAEASGSADVLVCRLLLLLQSHTFWQVARNVDRATVIGMASVGLLWGSSTS